MCLHDVLCEVLGRVRLAVTVYRTNLTSVLDSPVYEGVFSDYTLPWYDPWGLEECLRV